MNAGLKAVDWASRASLPWWTAFTEVGFWLWFYLGDQWASVKEETSNYAEVFRKKNYVLIGLASSLAKVYKAHFVSMFA